MAKQLDIRELVFPALREWDDVIQVTLLCDVSVAARALVLLKLHQSLDRASWKPTASSYYARPSLRG